MVRSTTRSKSDTPGRDGIARVGVQAALLLLVAVSCELPPDTPHAGACAVGSPLLIDDSTYDSLARHGAIDRVIVDPHAYFRFVHVRFASETCRRFEAVLENMPVVNLHGDAHLEQYAVTEDAAGLEDFDDSAMGPFLLDIVRFGASIDIACRLRGWPDEAPRIVARFLEGYRAAVAGTLSHVPVVSFARRARKRFNPDPERRLTLVEALSSPANQALRRRVTRVVVPYFDAQRRVDPSFGKGYFSVVDVRSLDTGVGSVLERRYLLRIQGPSEGASDDEFLELKEVRSLETVACLAREPHGAARVLRGDRLVAVRPDKLLGAVEMDGSPFWVHEWSHQYVEFEVSSVENEPEDFRDVAFAAGVQLGLGHYRELPASAAGPARSLAEQYLRSHRPQLDALTRSLADEIEQAWRCIRDRAANQRERPETEEAVRLEP